MRLQQPGPRFRKGIAVGIASRGPCGMWLRGNGPAVAVGIATSSSSWAAESSPIDPSPIPAVQLGPELDPLSVPQDCKLQDPLTDITRPIKLRWRIERDYQELKQELGLGHYEGATGAAFIITPVSRLLLTDF